MLWETPLGDAQYWWRRAREATKRSLRTWTAVQPLFLHAVMLICGAVLDAKEAHLLNGSLTFTRRESGSYVRATRINADAAIAAAVLAPRRMQHVDIHDLHVSLAHSYAVTLRDTARQMGIKVTGDLVPCAGCSEAEGIKMPVPWSTRCRAKNP